MKSRSTEQIAQLNQRSRYPLKADSLIASQDIPNSLENLKSHYRVHGSESCSKLIQYIFI